MTKQVIRGPRERLKVRSGIREQRFKVFALMIMGDEAAGDARTSTRCDWHPGHGQACRPRKDELKVRSTCSA